MLIPNMSSNFQLQLKINPHYSDHPLKVQKSNSFNLLSRSNYQISSILIANLKSKFHLQLHKKLNYSIKVQAHLGIHVFLASPNRFNFNSELNSLRHSIVPIVDGVPSYFSTVSNHSDTIPHNSGTGPNDHDTDPTIISPFQNNLARVKQFWHRSQPTCLRSKQFWDHSKLFRHISKFVNFFFFSISPIFSKM